MTVDSKGNIADFLPIVAAEMDRAPAIITPAGRDASGRVAYTHFTYRQLDRDTSRIARGLLSAGFVPGDRCALMVKPSLDFFALMFGLFRAGIIPVLIDPGIGTKLLRECLATAAPRGFIGIPAAMIARAILGWGRGSVEIKITAGRRWFPGGLILDDIRRMGEGDADFPVAETERDDIAAILFTSGSTGVPKGVVYTHGNFIEQVNMIGEMFNIEPGEIDLPTFPPFSLFDPALRMTALIPDMDARAPASVNPERIYEAFDNFPITNMFGSPGLLNTISRDAAERGKKLSGLRRVLSAGAPALTATLARMKELLDEGVEVYTPYGATECMPTCIIGSEEVLASRPTTDAGGGICVGKPFDRVTVSIIRIDEEPHPEFTDDLLLPLGEIGEIVVHGPTVTREYYQNPGATALAKMHDGEGRLHHRMGDVGYLDAEGRLWFCGRKSHRVLTKAGVLFTVPCEGVVNSHPKVFRSALVGVGAAGARRPVFCVELEPGTDSGEWTKIAAELKEITANNDHTKTIADFLLHPGLPVDIRHNAKIRREILGPWAAARIK